MRAWDCTSPPAVPATRPGLPRIHDTVTGRLLEVGPKSGAARLYACGITPYDATHLGHAFTYVSVDLLHRVWLDAGLEVHYAQNVTDVDDPLLERAGATGVPWEQLASQQVELFRADMAALRVLPPRDYVGVVESLPDVVALIQSMRATGTIYQVDDPEYPDWYFEVTQAPGFLDGLTMTPQGAEATFAERGGDPDRPGKRHPLDCLVWRMARPGEPSWDTALGRGRPGWHIECTAIALGALGTTFDVQAGGSDLAFPHHPMCAAEALVATGRPFAQAYLHTGMVALAGQKMSKSLGNLVFVRRLLDSGIDPMSIRLALLSHHYHDDWEFTDQDLAGAQERLQRWRLAFSEPVGAPGLDVADSVRAALRDNLDAPSALRLVDAWAASRGSDPAGPTLVATAVDALLGVAVGPRTPPGRLPR